MRIRSTLKHEDVLRQELASEAGTPGQAPATRVAPRRGWPFARRGELWKQALLPRSDRRTEGCWFPANEPMQPVLTTPGGVGRGFTSSPEMMQRREVSGTRGREVAGLCDVQPAPREAELGRGGAGSQEAGGGGGLASGSERHESGTARVAGHTRGACYASGDALCPPKSLVCGSRQIPEGCGSSAPCRGQNHGRPQHRLRVPMARMRSPPGWGRARGRTAGGHVQGSHMGRCFTLAQSVPGRRRTMKTWRNSPRYSPRPWEERVRPQGQANPT